MKIVEALNFMNEARGSVEGREAYSSKEGTKRDVKKSFKGRVRNYPSIRRALDDGQYGDIFTTKAAGRLYVVSKGKWGAKSGRGKIAKVQLPLLAGIVLRNTLLEPNYVMEKDPIS
jgi:hypothetical protein